MSCWVSCLDRSFGLWVSPVRSRLGSAVIGSCGAVLQPPLRIRKTASPGRCETTHSQPERRTTEDTSVEFAYTTETGQSGQVSEDAGR